MNPSSSLPIVAIYCKSLLPLSETFVVGQAEALRSWRPVFVGPTRAEPSLPLPEAYAAPATRGLAARWRRLRALLGKSSWPRTLRPGLVHAHFGVGGILAMQFAKSFDVPLVVTFHGYDTAPGLGRTGIAGWLLWALRRVLFRRATMLLAVSDHIASRLRALGAPSSKIVRLYTGIDVEVFTPPSDGSRPLRILFVGRLIAFKGVQYLVDAYERLVADRPSLELLIVGDGPMRAELEARTRPLPNCRWVGWQTPEQVRDHMRTARVFCGPSVVFEGRTEALGHVYLEAQASETPCVAFRVGGVPEAIEDGMTGLLAPLGDVEGLTECLARLVDDEALCRQMGSEGRQRVLAHFDIRKQTERLEKIYDELVARHAERK